MSLDFPSIDKFTVAMFGDKYSMKRNAMWRSIALNMMLARSGTVDIANALAGLHFRICLLEIEGKTKGFSSLF